MDSRLWTGDRHPSGRRDLRLCRICNDWAYTYHTHLEREIVAYYESALTAERAAREAAERERDGWDRRYHECSRALVASYDETSAAVETISEHESALADRDAKLAKAREALTVLIDDYRSGVEPANGMTYAEALVRGIERALRTLDSEGGGK